MTRAMHWVRTRHRRTLDDARERGGIAPMVAILAAVLLLATALVIDLSARVRTVSRAQTVAQEAARAGGQQVAPDAILGRDTGLDTSKAAAAARSYLRQSGHGGTVTVTGSTVVVTTTQTWSPVFLGTVGVGPEQITGTATIDTRRVQNGQEG